MRLKQQQLFGVRVSLFSSLFLGFVSWMCFRFSTIVILFFTLFLFFSFPPFSSLDATHCFGYFLLCFFRFSHALVTLSETKS